MENPLELLITDQEHDYLLSGFSALDKYFNIKDTGAVYISTDASLIDLAKIFPELEYPGLPYQDAAVTFQDTKYIFCCVEDVRNVTGVPFSVQKLLYDVKRGCFLDPYGIYWDLRKEKLVEEFVLLEREIVLMEAAKLVSRFGYQVPDDFSISLDYHISVDMQRDLLISILLARHSHKGLKLLFQEGFIEKYWPEIFEMADVKQTKDYHPEGDVWQHTLETLKYRKKIDLTLSLALLFHDSGKPEARGTNGTPDQPFKGHSFLGMKVADRFLRRLRFPESLIEDVTFLIRYHMMPHAITKLPLFRTEKVMDSPLFPLLLEVYRADSSSSFIGPDGYYEACRAYKNYLKNKKNPFTNKTNGGNPPRRRR